MARLLRVSRMKCAAGSVAATGIRVGLSAPNESPSYALQQHPNTYRVST